MPSCTRAPPESLMKTNGLPVFSDSLHHVGDLVAMHFAGRAAGHGEVLAGQVDQAAVDGGASGDHAIGGQFLVGHSEVAWRDARRKDRSPGSCSGSTSPSTRSRARELAGARAASRCAPCRRPAVPRSAPVLQLGRSRILCLHRRSCSVRTSVLCVAMLVLRSICQIACLNYYRILRVLPILPVRPLPCALCRSA